MSELMEMVMYLDTVIANCHYIEDEETLAEKRQAEIVRGYYLNAIESMV